MSDQTIIVTDRAQLRELLREELQDAVKDLFGTDKPMNCSEAAKFLKTSVWSIRRKCSKGTLKAKKDGRDWLILQSELLRHAKGA